MAEFQTFYDCYSLKVAKTRFKFSSPQLQGMFYHATKIILHFNQQRFEGNLSIVPSVLKG